MLIVLTPIVLVIAVILIPFPKIGGNVRIALLIGALTAAVLGKLSPGEIILASGEGIDKLAWVIGLSIFGSIYAQTQVKLGTMDTVLNTFRSLFGRTPKGLIAAVIVTLVLAGSLLGDGIAAATVIGTLVVLALIELKLTPEQIGATILMGSFIGAVMPPITQAIFLSSALVGLESPAAAVNISYITVGIGVILAIYVCSRFVKIKKLPEHLIPEKNVSQIIKEDWHTLVPLTFLVIIVIVRSVSFEIPILYSLVMMIDKGFIAIFGWIPILSGITFRVTQAIITAIVISFFFSKVRDKRLETIKTGLKNVSKTVQIQVCAGIMVGMFYAAGLIDRVVEITQGLSETIVTFGGGIGLALLGMLTGSQTTAQNTIVPLMGPILTETFEISKLSAVLGASHIAVGGQAFPPVSLTAFVVAGIVGGVVKEKEVDPVKIMLYALPVDLYFIIVGLLAWFGHIG